MDHPSAVYTPPSFLQEACTPQAYRRWLARKARAHVKRDRARGNITATIEEYKQSIHLAVERCGGRDEYTGQPLRWGLISRYNNAESKKRGRAYKKEFGDLPTVDHIGDGRGPADFVICSWRVNDAKNDLDLSEFRELCAAVLAFARAATDKPFRACQYHPICICPGWAERTVRATCSNTAVSDWLRS